MVRAGGFNPTLDPFGGGRGGLGRYNITGDTIQSLAEYEAYAVAVAWANGTATDEEYLASLEKLLSLATPGTREFVTATNRLNDAKYTIGRNKLVRAVNQATTQQTRISALKALQAYETSRLQSMDATNSEAYREQQDRVAGAAIDIRQAQYAELVEKVNRGQASTQSLLELATKLQKEAAGAPDADEWRMTVGDLTDRVADEKLADSFQAYQHNRKSGASLLADIDRRLAQMQPGSPQYRELARQREDLAKRVKDENSAIEEQKMAGRRSSGKVDDKEYLAYLKDQYEQAVPGTAEAIAAGNRLQDYTFSLAEDKLRFDVSKGKRSVGELIRFYKTYQRGMDPGSERWRQLQSAIDTLSRGGGLASGGRGGGGGGGGGSSKGISLGPKIITGDSLLIDLLGGGSKNKAPPGFADLLRIDVNNATSRKWFDNNLRSMVDAFQDGRGYWIYYDKSGRQYQMPFVPSMMTDMDALNVRYMHAGLASADSAKEAQTWVGRIITATKSGQERNARYTMDVYTQTFAAIERAKQNALAGGRYGEYSNLVREQLQLTRFILGTPDGQSPNAANATNPYLTDDDKQRIMADLERLAPKNIDETSQFYNPNGDAVLGLIQSGAITTKSDPVTGDIITAQLDPNRGYVTQLPDGSIGLVEVNPAINPEAFRPDEITGTEVPRYRDENVNVTIRLNGEDVNVWQPVVRPADQTADQSRVPSGGLVYQIDRGIFVFDTGAGRTAALEKAMQGKSVSVPGNWQPGLHRPVIDPITGRNAALSLFSTYTVEKGKTIKWVSTDGKTWVRYSDGSSVSPRIVLNSDVTIDANGQWVKNGQVLDATAAVSNAHIWGPDDAVAAGARDDGQWGVGAPGASMQIRKPTLTGGFDFRPQWVIDAEENQMLFERSRRNNQPVKPKGQTYVQVVRPDGTGELVLAPDLEVRPLGPGVADPGTNRAQRSRNQFGLGEAISDAVRRTGELLPKIARKVISEQGLRPKGFGGIEEPLRDWGVKPKPTPTLKPPPQAKLEPVATPKIAPKRPTFSLPPLKLPPKPKNTTGAKAAGGKDDRYIPPKSGGGKKASKPPTPAPKKSPQGRPPGGNIAL